MNQKKLSFKHPIQDRDELGSSELDDDYILPNKSYQTRFRSIKYYKPVNEYARSETRPFNSEYDEVPMREYTYKKASCQPEDNIWIKQMPAAVSSFPTNMKSCKKNHIEVSI